MRQPSLKEQPTCISSPVRNNQGSGAAQFAWPSAFSSPAPQPARSAPATDQAHRLLGPSPALARPSSPAASAL
ncbi:UNVERIFIED_CONTAM: hypothetical protein Slati_3323900, partial [Sesamum latifolium]